MSHSSRLPRLSACCLWIACSLPWILPTAATAQAKPQFILPQVELTGRRVTSFLPGSFQLSPVPDILYVNALSSTASTFQVTVGELLNQPNGFTNLAQNQLSFPNVLSVSAALADFDNDRITDYAFALSPIVAGANDLCVYYGTGASTGSGSSFSGGNAYPPTGKSGCMSFPIQGNLLPTFAYIAATPLSTAEVLPQLILEDSANGYLYILANSGANAANGVLSGFTVKSVIAIPSADGPGPIYTGDFNGDGNTDILINNQAGYRITLYQGNGDGTFQPPVYVPANGNVHSMLLHDMDGDGIPDLIAELDNGVIEILHGTGSSTPAPFGIGPIGGTFPGLNGLSGNGGHLAAIGDVNHDGIADILTTTPIGLSVLLGQSAGPANLSYQLKGIYNIGPGRSSFALGNFLGTTNLDLAVDSPEGVAIVPGNGDGTFQTSSAYAAGAPGLSATLADFNNDGKPDVVIATGTTQAQVLLGNGLGGFTPLPAPTNTAPSPNPTLWSAILTGDFDGDGNQDLLYSLTGLPLPPPGSNAGSGLYLQYGKGDGTFEPPQAILGQYFAAPADNNFYGESAVADLNGDGISDIVNLDTDYYDVLLSQRTAGAFTLGLNIQEDTGANDSEDLDSFSQVAAGHFSGSGPTGQDLVFQDDANIIPYVNTGLGTFNPMPPLANPPPLSSFYGGTILIADVDGDGNGDIIVPYHNLAANPANPTPGNANLLYIWYGHGDGTFSQPQITALSRNYYLAQVVDMNGDGLPDIVLSDGYLVSIIYNQGSRSFGTMQPNGQLAGEQHFLAGQGINSLSLADVNGDGSLDLIVSNGGATISDAIAIGGLNRDSQGNPVTSISLTPNSDVSTGGITVLLNNIKTRPVTGNLVATPFPSQYQASFNMIATLTSTAGVPLPTGTVQFAITLPPNTTPTPLGSPVNVVAGTTTSSATYTIPAGNPYADGEYAISATYSGDTYNSPVTFTSFALVQGSSTTTALALCVGGSLPNCPLVGTPTNITPMTPLSMIYGQIYNGIESAVSNDGTTLTSPLNFYQDGVDICSLPAFSAGQTCPATVGTGLPAGSNSFFSQYPGDTTHSASTSQTIVINVAKDSPSAMLASSLNPALQGQTVTLTATLLGANAPPTNVVGLPVGNYIPPTGVVTFLSGNAVLGTGTLTHTSGAVTSTAAFTTSTLLTGVSSITISYAGDSNFNPLSSSPTLNQTITPAIPTSTTLTSSLNPSTVGQPVTFTATVSSGTGSPTGTVAFLDGAATLGTVPLANGVATFTTSTLAAGAHNITATFSGSTTLAPSTSAILTQVVDTGPPPGTKNFTITVTPTPVSVGVGNSAALTVTVTPLNGFTQAVNLACTNLPNEAACTFADPTIASGGGSTTLLLSTMAPHSCGSSQPYFIGGSGAAPGSAPNLTPLALPALAGLAVLFVPGRRRWLRALIAAAAIAGTLQITACGNCTDLGTRPATYTFQVTGAAATPAETESQSVTLNVTI